MGLDTLDAFAVVVSSSALGWEGNFNLPNMLAIKEPTSKLDNFIGTLVGNLKSLEAIGAIWGPMVDLFTYFHGISRIIQKTKSYQN